MSSEIISGNYQFLLEKKIFFHNIILSLQQTRSKDAGQTVLADLPFFV